MPYTFYIIGGLGACYYLWNRFVYLKKKKEPPLKNTYTKKQIKCFKGEDKPSIDFHGRLINMDEHTKDLYEK